jgi:two-component system KDP operon response regulator KdpE
MKPIILLIEDDPQIRRFLRASLVTQGYELIEAGTGREGLALAAAQVPEVVLLDLGLPDMEGLEVIKQLRGWSSVPIIILSARGQERDKVANLDAGADDYLTKPFGVGELLARVRVALRHAARTQSGGATVLRFGAVELDLERRRVTRAAQEVRLTPIEFRLLACLAQHFGKVVTHRQLLREVWGPSHVEHTHYLRIYMKQLREKLEDDPVRPRYLLTESGVGYRLVEE